MKIIMIDTHIVIWLYSGNVNELSKIAQTNIETHDLLISPIILLELQYLLEIGKILISPKEIYNDLHFRIGLRIDNETLWSNVTYAALELNWTRDPFDRLICAHAKVLKSKLITRDKVILSNFDKAIW